MSEAQLLVNILLTIINMVKMPPERRGCRGAALTGGYHEEATTSSRWLLGLGNGQRLGKHRRQGLIPALDPGFRRDFHSNSFA